MRIPIKSLLFKAVTDINWRALTGQERGQYDLRLGTDAEFEHFFDPFPAVDVTQHGGWDRHVTFATYDGANPVPERQVKFHYMGPTSQRKDFYFASQKHDLPDAYPLWNPNRVATPGAAYNEVAGSYAVVARDIEDRFHARWLSPGAVAALPTGLRAALTQTQKGVVDMPTSADAISAAAQRVIDALLRHHNVLIYGPPGTGKTHVLQEVQRAFGAVMIDTESEATPIVGAEQTHSAWVTFHQSYSYEDFIVGLRPQPLSGGGFTLEAVPGVLLEMSEWARSPGRRSLLVIDEINRGNVSRIFGELITLLEVDKRLASDGTSLPTTVHARLPYVAPGVPLTVTLRDGTTPNVELPFALPHHVYVLATMNSVDTSVAPLDAALRRRFSVVEFAPDLELMAAQLGVSSLDDPLPDPLSSPADVAAIGLRALRTLNDGVGAFLGPDFQFGHWFLEPLTAARTVEEAMELLHQVWSERLFPQLVEYFAGRTEQLVQLLGDAAGSGLLDVHTPPPEWELLGASPYLASRAAGTAAETLRFMTALAKGETTAAPD